MTRLKMTLATATLSIAFVPALHAYEFEPGNLVPDRTAELAVPTSQKATTDDACSLPIASVLKTMLALPDDIYAETYARSETSLACAKE
jgi:hypothetical protein